VSARRPLERASSRLRRPPGRPRRGLAEGASGAAQVPAAVRPPEAVVPALCPPSRPRLLGVEAAATYLGIGPRTVRDLVRLGSVPAVKLMIPGAGRGRPFSRLLVDVLDLDALIARSKVTAPEPEPARVARMARARAARSRP
jgi:helix-turn-helix protein